jgi:6-phosphogluconolactonase
VKAVTVLKNPEAVLAALADLMATQAGEFIARTGRFNLALSGGSSPRNLYQLLASEVYRDKIDWRHV